MLKIRVLLFSALAVVLAFGILGQQALAQDAAGNQAFHATAIGHPSPGSTDAATPGMFQGITAMGPNPPAAGDWPCFAGNTACSAIASGGLVVGVPVQVWPVASANGQIYWTFETTTSAGTAKVSVKVTQGATTILSVKGKIPGIAANSIYSIDLTGASFTGAVAGPATITTSTKIGTTTIKGTAKIVLQ
jgi:hypothetical protein